MNNSNIIIYVAKNIAVTTVTYTYYLPLPHNASFTSASILAYVYG